MEERLRYYKIMFFFPLIMLLAVVTPFTTLGLPETWGIQFPSYFILEKNIYGRERKKFGSR